MSTDSIWAPPLTAVFHWHGISTNVFDDFLCSVTVKWWESCHIETHTLEGAAFVLPGHGCYSRNSLPWGESWFCMKCVGMSMYWNLGQTEQTLCGKLLYTKQHTGTCVFTGVVAGLTADFTREPESPNSVTDNEGLCSKGKTQTALLRLSFLSQQQPGPPACSALTISPPSESSQMSVAKCPSSPCQVLNSKFIRLSVCVLGRPVWECCPRWACTCWGLHSVMTTDLLSPWVSSEMIWTNSVLSHLWCEFDKNKSYALV